MKDLLFKLRSLLEVNKNCNINTIKYCYGVYFTSDPEDRTIEFTKSFFVPLRLKYFPDPIISDIQLDSEVGRNLDGERDENWENLPGFLYPWSRAIKFNRPDWVLLYMLGKFQGALNYVYNKEFLNKNLEFGFEYFSARENVDQKDYIQYFRMLPFSFVSNNKNEIMFLYNYFDETGFDLDIQLLEGNYFKVEFVKRENKTY